MDCMTCRGRRTDYDVLKAKVALVCVFGTEWLLRLEK